MAALILLLAACCVTGLLADDELPIDEVEMNAIQERLSLLEYLEKSLEASDPPEEAREEEEECLPEGAACKFASGPNCCGVRLRCFVFDHYTPQTSGVNLWHSRCRPYLGGKAADAVKTFFENIAG